MNHIPSVDLRDFLSDDKNKKSLFVQSIGKAFQDIGFCAVRGHFLDEDLIKRLYKNYERKWFSCLMKFMIMIFVKSKILEFLIIKSEIPSN